MKHNWILWGAAVFAFCSLAGYALAVERWEHLGKHALGEMYLERPSVSQKGSVVTYWVRRMYNTPQESKISQMKFTEQRVLHVLDCNQHTVGMTQMIFYDAKGKPVGAYKDLKKAPQHIQPTGFFAKEEKLLCPAVGKATPLSNKAMPSPIKATPLPIKATPLPITATPLSNKATPLPIKASAPNPRPVESILKPLSKH